MGITGNWPAIKIQYIFYVILNLLYITICLTLYFFAAACVHCVCVVWMCVRVEQPIHNHCISAVTEQCKGINDDVGEGGRVHLVTGRVYTSNPPSNHFKEKHPWTSPITSLLPSPFSIGVDPRVQCHWLWFLHLCPALKVYKAPRHHTEEPTDPSFSEKPVTSDWDQDAHRHEDHFWQQEVRQRWGLFYFISLFQ